MKQRVYFSVGGVEYFHVSKYMPCSWCDEPLQLNTTEDMEEGFALQAMTLTSNHVIVVCDECGQHNFLQINSSAGKPTLPYAVTEVYNIIDEGDLPPVFNPHRLVDKVIVQYNCKERVGKRLLRTSTFVYSPEGNVAFRSPNCDNIIGKHYKATKNLWIRDCFTTQFYVEGNGIQFGDTVKNYVDNLRENGFDKALDDLVLGK